MFSISHTTNREGLCRRWEILPYRVFSLPTTTEPKWGIMKNAVVVALTLIVSMPVAFGHGTLRTSATWQCFCPQSTTLCDQGTLGLDRGQDVLPDQCPNLLQTRLADP